MKVTTFGLDLAKRVFQLHWVDMETGEICRRQLERAEMAEFFARREPSVGAMEACGSAHYWGRRLSGYGHDGRLIAAQFVRPFVKHNQTDAADAQAIWEAAQRAGEEVRGDEERRAAECTDAAPDARAFGSPTVDSQWAAEVTRYNVARIRAQIPPLREI